MVIESSDAAAIAKVLVNASGRNSRPVSPPKANTGRKLTVMISRLKNSVGPTSLAAAMNHFHAGRASPVARAWRDALLFAIQMLVRIFHHDNRAVHHDADGNRDPAQAHDVGVDAQQVHDQQTEEHAGGQHENGDQSLRPCSRNTMQTSATTAISSSNVWRRVWIDRSIRSERS